SGEVAEYPLPRARIAEIMAAGIDADNVTVTLPRNLSGLDLSEFGILPVAPSERPALLPGQSATEIEPALIEGVWTQAWTVEGDLAAVKVAMLANLADRRYAAEEAG